MTDMTDADIIAGLRSADAKKRREALDALTEGEGQALFLRVTESQTQWASTSNAEPRTAFMAILVMAQTFGKALGLDLNWVQRPPDPHQVVIARGLN